MANPLIAQGTLNRLRGSIVWQDNPQLNVTASFLGEAGIGLRMAGPVTTRINTMTGSVTSPEPYAPIVLTLNLLRTQSLADLYKQQMELLSTIGGATFRPDAKTLSPYVLFNCSIDDVGELTVNGKDAGYVVTCGGYWLINSQLWDTA